MTHNIIYLILYILFDFGCGDSSTPVNIHRTFCMDLYGCELWNISSKYTEYAYRMANSYAQDLKITSLYS